MEDSRTECDPAWVTSEFQKRKKRIQEIGYALVAKKTGLGALFLLQVLSTPNVENVSAACEVEPAYWSSIFTTIDTLSNSELRTSS